MAANVAVNRALPAIEVFPAPGRQQGGGIDACESHAIDGEAAEHLEFGIAVFLGKSWNGEND